MTRRSHRRPFLRRGFSLLEAVLAMAVVLVLGALGMNYYSRVIESAAIDSGAQKISDLLADARQDAINQNRAVEVRIYQAAAGPRQPVAYGALQLHWIESDGTTPPATPLMILPSAAVIDATTVHSSLVTTNTETPPVDPGDTRITPLTRVFHFLPNGSTDLATTGKWLLTLRAVSQSDPARFPANWACVEINPTTGRTQIYRP